MTELNRSYGVRRDGVMRNSREDLHYNLNEWPTGSKSVDQGLHAVIDRAFDLEAALERISTLKPAMADTCPICRRTYDGTGEPHEFDCPVGIARTALKGK